MHMSLALIGCKCTVIGVIAVILLGLLIWGAWCRLIWRLLSVLGMGTGVGFLVWGILMAAMRQEPPFGSPPEIIAGGAGVLAGSIVLLVISFCGGCSPRKP